MRNFLFFIFLLIIPFVFFNCAVNSQNENQTTAASANDNISGADKTVFSSENDDDQEKCQANNRLDSYYNDLVKNKSFSGVVFVSKKGHILLNKGYYLRNAENNLPNTNKTVFSIASLSKAFTSMSVMILKERKLINLDDYVEKYIPEFPYKNKIKIRNLLNMNSGIMDYTENPDLFADNWYHTPQQLLPYFINKPLNFEPGSKWEYSNSNYILLGVIIEKISGKSFNTFITENILSPLKMHSTGYDPTDTITFHNRAIGYDDIFSNPPVKTFHLHPSIPYCAGGMYSTLGDMYKWDQALYTNKIVSYNSLKELFTPVLNNYGAGWYNDSLEIDGKSYKKIWHHGAFFGFYGYFARFVNDKITIIILLNKSPTTGTQDELLPLVKDTLNLVLKN